jgi:hypothetical protein
MSKDRIANILWGIVLWVSVIGISFCAGYF